jgi:DHA1 family bicyclomycin/chloramphenicol resistance-like MFS transporter
VDNPPHTALDPKSERKAPVRLILLLIAMSMTGPMATHIVVPAVPGLVQKFNTDAGTAQLTVSLFLMGLATAQLFLGPLSDRFGRRPVLLAGLGLTTLTGAAASFAPTIGWLVFVRTIQSFGASSGLVLGRAMIRDLYGRERAASMMATVTMVMAIAPMLSPLLGGLLDTLFGWRSIFIAITLASFCVLVWVFVALPETRPVRVTPVDNAQLWRDARALFASRSFIGYVLMAALGTGTHFSFIGAAPHLVINQMGLSSATYGAWFVIVAVGYVVGNFFTSRLTMRYGIHAIIMAGIATMTAGAILSLALLLIFPNGGPAVLFIPQFVLSIASGLMLPNAIAGAVSVRPEAAGTASGLTGFIQQGSGAIAAQIMGFVVAEVASPMPVAIVMLVIAVLTIISFFGLVRPRARAG